MRARQSATAAKVLADSAAALEDPKATSADCHTADIKRDRTSASTSAPHSSSSNEHSELSEQQDRRPQPVASQEALLGIAIMPVDHAIMQVMQQQAATHAEAAADLATITSSSTQQPLFFLPVDALLCKADLLHPAQQNQNQQQQQPPPPLPSILPTSFLCAEFPSRSTWLLQLTRITASPHCLCSALQSLCDGYSDHTKHHLLQQPR